MNDKPTGETPRTTPKEQPLESWQLVEVLRVQVEHRSNPEQTISGQAATKIEELERDLTALRAELKKVEGERDALRKELNGHKAWARDVNEALNTGDGKYQP